MSSNSLSSKSVYNFSKLEEVVSIPDLLAIQVNSMEDFLQEEVLPEKRENIGLEAVFRSVHRLLSVGGCVWSGRLSEQFTL